MFASMVGIDNCYFGTTLKLCVLLVVVIQLFDGGKFNTLEFELLEVWTDIRVCYKLSLFDT
jgi:hypothetical protein